MLTYGLTVHQNIIQVHSDILKEHICKHIVHQALECGQSICQTQQHDDILEQAFRGEKGSLVFVPFCNRDLVIGGS